MNGPIFIVSDNHFSNTNSIEEEKRRQKLFDVFEKIKLYKNSTLIIGGDFFDYWFEYDEVIPSGYDSLIEELKKLKDKEINIHYVLGNHDFWDFGFLKKEIGINTHKGDFAFNYAQQKILITHGDGLLKKDHGYRILKKIIRHPLFIKIFKLFPPTLTCNLSKKISKSSAHYNHHDKHVATIKNDVLEFSQKKWKEGYNTVLVGHYHQTGILNENNNKMIFLGDWLSKFTVTMINEKKYWQGDWESFVDLAY